MPFTAGVHCFKRVVTDTEPKTTSSEQFIDLIDNPAGGPLVAFAAVPPEQSALIYLSHHSLMASVQNGSDQFCSACFNGNYPVPLTDEALGQRSRAKRARPFADETPPDTVVLCLTSWTPSSQRIMCPRKPVKPSSWPASRMAAVRNKEAKPLTSEPVSEATLQTHPGGRE